MIEKTDGFRKDINGLRAWAVVAVIGYHFSIAGFPGGFIGVDVFFVLSGFLMAGIVIGGVETIDGSAASIRAFLAKFYLARARRIVPALAVLCAVILVVDWFVMSAKEYEGVGKNIVSALAFLSNFRFNREAGYFDASSHEKVLLHTWSLSVEWQFYLLFPLIVIGLYKLSRSRRRLAVALACLTAASLALSILTSASMPARAFFLLPWRAWELLGGALIWLLYQVRPRLGDVPRIALEIAGFLLILGSIVLLDASVVWPGWLAVVPVTGTALVLLASRQDSILSGSRVAQWLGKASYSLYLWHWPIVVALYYLELETDPVARLAGLALTLLLGWLSYRWIETPTRTRLARMPRRLEFGAIMAGLLAVMLSAHVVRSFDGFPSRLPPEVNAIFKAADDANPRMMQCQGNDKTRVSECTYGGPDLGVVVIGDSHAGNIVRSVEKALPSPNLHVLDWTMAGCKTIAGMKKIGGQVVSCGEFVQYAVDKNKTLPPAPLVILNRTSVEVDPQQAAVMSQAPGFYISKPHASHDAAFFEEIREGLISTACEFAKTRPVYYVRPIPEMKYHVPKSMGRALMWGHRLDVSISLDAYRKRHAWIWATQDLAAQRCGVKILDPLPYLCDKERCYGAVDGIPIYGDDNHLNMRGADRMIPMFRTIFEPEVAPPSGASS